MHHGITARGNVVQRAKIPSDQQNDSACKKAECFEKFQFDYDVDSENPVLRTTYCMECEEKRDNM